jgi:hypothetical protein
MRVRMLLAWSTPLIATVLVSAAVGLFLTRPAEVAITVFTDPLLAAPSTLAAAMVAAFIVWRSPGNAVGWAVSAIAILFAISNFSDQYAMRWRAVPADFPAGLWFAWLIQWMWFVPVMLLIGFLPLVFPNGRPLTPRWRPALLLMALATLAASVFGALPAGPMAGLAGHDNPVGFIPETVVPLLVVPVAASLFGAALVAVGSLVVRFRRATDIERQQLKWLVYAVVLVVICFFTSAFAFLTGRASDTATAVFLLSLGLIPLAIGIAILRYRLYDIDLLINRTIVYAVVSATLLATYITGVAAFQFVLSPFIAGSPIAVAGSTLGVVALFQPVRSRIQNLVDRRFFRQRYDAERTLDLFSDRLREHVDIDMLERELVAVVGATIQPSHVSVWLRRRAI